MGQDAFCAFSDLSMTWLAISVVDVTALASNNNNHSVR